MTLVRARDKLVTLDALLARVRAARRRGESIVFTNGCFDLLHRGHVRSLERARRAGDRLIVAINSDASVRRAKGSDRPIQSARERMEIVAGLGCVDWIIGFGADTPLRLIERVRPDVLAKGGDWELDDIVGREVVESAGGSVLRLPIVAGSRTSETIRRIRSTRPRHAR